MGTQQDAYVIFGVHGILGEAFFGKLCDIVPDYRVYAFDHSRIDVSNQAHVRSILSFVKPTVVLNCASVSDPEICEEAPSGAYQVNARGAEIVGDACSAINAKLVHFSTCHVFDGRRVIPYGEKSKPHPMGTYAKSKYDGELALRKVCPTALVIRPGWLFDSDGECMVSDWISRAERGMKVPVRDDCHGSPTYVPDLVDATMELLDRKAGGVYHIANSEAASMQSFAETVLSMCSLRPDIQVFTGLKNSWFKAPLPQNTVLSTKKYTMTTAGKKIRPWSDALKQCLFLMNRYKP